MATMQGTDKPPFQRPRRLSEQQATEMTDKQKQFYRERLEAWKAFKASPAGDACFKIAEVKARELLSILTAPTYELCLQFQLDPSEVERIREEARGRYAVWDEILHDQERIFEALARLQVEEARRTVGKQGLVVPPGAGRVVAP
jgi:hypothetical protein